MSLTSRLNKKSQEAEEQAQAEREEARRLKWEGTGVPQPTQPNEPKLIKPKFTIR